MAHAGRKGGKETQEPYRAYTLYSRPRQRRLPFENPQRAAFLRDDSHPAQKGRSQRPSLGDRGPQYLGMAPEDAPGHLPDHMAAQVGREVRKGTKARFTRGHRRPSRPRFYQRYRADI